MTVSAITRSVAYSGYGAIGAYPVPFRFLTDTSLTVSVVAADGTETPFAPGPDYTVAGVDLEGGGSVTPKRAIGQTEQLIIVGNSDLAQPTVYVPNDPFPAKSHERGLDRAMIAIQELRERVGRTLSFGAGEAGFAFRRKLARVASVFGFDASGAAIVWTMPELAAQLFDPFRALFGAGFKGDPGANVMAVGLFASLAGLSVPIGTDLIQTSGYGARGVGQAQYVYDPAVTPSIAAANPTWAKVTANGRGFRLSDQQFVLFTMFGADPTGATPCDTALIAAQNYADLGYSWRGPVDGRHRATVPIHCAGTFYFANDISIKKMITITGNCTGQPGATPSVFEMAAGKTFYFDFYNTSYGVPTAAGTDAAGSEIEGIYFVSRGETGASHAIDMRTVANVRRCLFRGFNDAVHIVTQNGGPAATQGAANNWQVDTIFAVNCTNGLFVSKDDSNAGEARHVSAVSCRGWAVSDTSGLGNYHYAHHANACGTNAFCNYNGQNWQCVDPSRAGATVPGTDATVWLRNPFGAASDYPSAGQWQAGHAYNIGGAYRIEGDSSRTTLEWCYSESGQPPSWGGQHCMKIGGIHAAGFVKSPFSSGTFVSIDNETSIASITPGILTGSGDPNGRYVATQVAGTPGVGLLLRFMDTIGLGPDTSSQFSSLRARNGNVEVKASELDGTTSQAWTTPTTTFRPGGRPTPHAHVAWAPNGLYAQNVGLFSGTGPPTQGDWARGAIIWNENAAIGQPKGWQCTGAGSPGTWSSMGNL